MKSIRISIEPADGTVKVSAPKRVSLQQIHNFVESKKARIEKTQAHYTQMKDLLTVPVGEVLLHGEGYTLHHLTNETGPQHHIRKKKRTINHATKTIHTILDLTITANQIAFYKAYAKEYLTPKLQEIAEKYGFTYAKCIIRGQKTKRGTCSSTKNIGLNWKLVKMPHAIAEYVMCHELAHLKHLNHSQDFWNEVAVLCPTYKQAHVRMKKYGLSVQ